MIRRTKNTELVDELDRVCFPADERLTASELHDGEWWIAYVDGEPVGFVGTLCGFLLRYGTVPARRESGVGLALARVAVRHHARLGQPLDTYVIATNVPSLRCLLRAGFVVTHATTDEYATYLHMATGPRG